jgi:lipopolysaccharide/colanic/teichoic acid biosynthesis glycosyltransferase
MDIIGALVGLIFTALIYLPTAVAIKLDSHGPVIFGQLRVGKNFKNFMCYKFRTMFLNSSRNGQKPGPNDERVTRMGWFLRRTSLDELPQFFNILRGEMSLVGPRPEQLPLLANYAVWQRQRFTVKPGLTGWWQVNGRKQPMHEHIDEDIYYVKHRSLGLDLTILWRTLGAVLGGDGAV